MLKVFIAQPMKNLTREEILKVRNGLQTKVEKMLGEKVEVLDTIFDDSNEFYVPLDYVAESIKYLAKADLAIFASGWRDSRGCRVEHLCAKEYDISRIEFV